MPRSRFPLALLALGLLWAADASARQKSETLTPAKIDTKMLAGDLLQGSVVRYAADPARKDKAKQLADLVGDLRVAAMAAEYDQPKRAVGFDGTKFAGLKSPDRPAVEDGLKDWLQFALETQPALEVGGVGYTRMSDADIKAVVATLAVRYPAVPPVPPVSDDKIKALEERLLRAERQLLATEDEVRRLRTALNAAPTAAEVRRLEDRIAALEAGGGSGGGSTSSAAEWRLMYYMTPGCCGYGVWPVWVYTPRPAARPGRTGGSGDSNGTAVRPADGAEFVSLGGGAPRKLADLNTRGAKATDADAYFWRGYSLFWAGEHQQARQHFRAAATLDDDARYWYYLGLAERRIGDAASADDALRRGAAAQARQSPSPELLGRALERVQGADRGRIRDAADRAR